MPIPQSRERPKKILVAMYELSGGTTKSLKYEDIVVRAFKLFPDEFALRGYPEYPDSSDIHKPLYGPLKRDGYIRSANKTFALTPRGVEAAQSLIKTAGEQALTAERDPNRMPRDVVSEIERMINSEAFLRFVGGKKETILDTDFYVFAGCTVRTPRNEFLGRLKTTSESIKIARKLKQPTKEQANTLGELWSFLQEKFKTHIERRRNS